MARPKGIKQGTVYYNKAKQKWIVMYYGIDDKKGLEKRMSKSFKNKQEADDFFTAMMYQKSNPIFIENNGIPLNQLMRSNLQKKLDMNLISEVQFNRVEKTINVIEKNALVKRKIEDITSEEIQDYMNSLKNYSNSYIKKIMEQFTQAYKFAINKGYINKNPLVDVIKPKSTKTDKVVRALEIEEQQLFTNYLKNKTIEEEPYKNVYLIQMYMGLRVGEALAITNMDIDLRHNILKVDKTITLDKYDRRIVGNSTKTYAGIREIPIPEFIRYQIMEQMKLAEKHKENRLFESRNGNIVDSKNVNYILKDRLKKLGITGITTHSLRHTYGTRCVEAGMRAVALQRLMGHKDVSVTLNTYTSIFNKYKESELEKVNAYYLDNELFSANKLLEQNNNLIEVINTEKGDEKEIKQDKER